MKNKKIKLASIIFVAGVVLAVPINANFTYGYGESSVLPGSTTLPKECNSAKPAAPIFFQPSNSGNGVVSLKWVKTDLAGKYTIGYGVASGNYIYGVPDTGNVDNFKVGYLSPGKKYYFAVRGVNDCTPGAWSQERSIIVNGGFANTYNNSLASNPPASGTNYFKNPPTPTMARSFGAPAGNQQNGNTNPAVGGQNNTNNFSVPTLPPVVPTPIENQGFFQSIANFFGGLFGLN